MLKYTVSSIAPSVIKLFNLSIHLGRIPDCWKEAMIVPIPYINLKVIWSWKLQTNLPHLYSLCKLLEKHIYGLMYKHLFNYHLLSDSQWGFRSGRSTVTALLSVIKEWLSALKYGQEVCAVFFDYRKAFDSIPHLPLLKKLDILGFNDHILHWVSGYLASRTQCLMVNLLCLLLLFLEYHRVLFLIPFFFGSILTILPRSASETAPKWPCMQMMCCCFELSTHLNTLLNSRMILIKLGTSPAPTISHSIGINANTWLFHTRKLYLPHHHHFCLKAIGWKCSSIWVFSYHMISLGVNMFNQSAVRLGRSLDFSTEDFTIMLQVVLCFNSTSPSLGPISIMPQPSGPLP